MTVAVAAGVVIANNIRATVTGGNVTLTADGSDPRYGIVTSSSTGAISATMGIAAANPIKPDLPANSILLADVYIPAADSAIQSNQIIDKRIILGLQSTEIEIDFGSIPQRTKIFTITDSVIAANAHMVAVQSANAATGRSADENEMDPIIFSILPGSGQFTLNATPMAGPVIGKYKVMYGEF